LAGEKRVYGRLCWESSVGESRKRQEVIGNWAVVAVGNCCTKDITYLLVVLVVVVRGEKLIIVFSGREESVWAAVLGEFGRREWKKKRGYGEIVVTKSLAW
jgi:hypothetical protein